MPLTLNGPELVLSASGQLNTDRFGLSAATAKWWYVGDEPESKVGIFSKHPRWEFLECDRRTITRNDDATWTIEATYFGVDPGNEPEKIYQLSGSLSSEPIQTHPFFPKFAAPGYTSGSIFETDGSFKEFVKMPLGSAATVDATNPAWIGVRDYLAPGVTWTETEVTKTKPTGTDLDALGYIDDAPPGEPPTPTDRDWLMTDFSYEQKGKTYVIRREWRLSGPNGWNKTIYTKEFTFDLGT
jgi:hypothetical protein